MSLFFQRSKKKAGLPPGTVVYVGEKRTDKVSFEVIDYTEDKFLEEELKEIDEAFPFKELPTVTWLNVVGLHDTEVIEKLGKHFELHPLIQEDIVNTGQRPSFEDNQEYLFITLKMLTLNENRIDPEHISLVIGHNYCISFQEKEGDVFNTVRDRIKNARKKIRKSGSDYLAYSLVDAIVDNYFIVLEKLGDRIEDLEEAINNGPTKETLQAIHELKRELIFLRKSVWPLREVISKLSKSESKLINKKTQVYINDVYDHTIQVIDTIESYRDMVSGMIDLYLSTISNKMNEVMKVLTIFAAIFIPLTFVAGVYGMNFDIMPELRNPNGYYLVWGVFILMAGGMLVYFKKKGWL